MHCCTLTGYAEMTMAGIERFRQLGSRTADHPEYGHAPGIETPPEARQHLAAATVKALDLTASNVLPAELRAMFEEGREKFMDGLRKVGLPE